MRDKIQAPGKQVLHKQVPKAQALQKEKDPRLVAVGGFGQAYYLPLYYITPLMLCQYRAENPVLPELGELSYILRRTPFHLTRRAFFRHSHQAQK